MTIAISLKVNDGVVLAADSASTILQQSTGGAPTVINVYNNANKVFNLVKGLPIGAITWGAGAIGQASISTLIKDLRRRLSGADSHYTDWHVDRDNYTVDQIAGRVKAFIYDELYQPTFQAWPDKPALGFIVAGYSTGQTMAEEYQVFIEPGSGTCRGPTECRPLMECGASWNGEPEAISRLLLGFGTNLGKVLTDNLGVPAGNVQPALDVIKQALAVQVISSAMPIQDAIDLAEFLVDLTVKFSRFTPFAQTVGGPIEIAAITTERCIKK